MSDIVQEALHDLYKIARIISDNMRLDVDKFIYDGDTNAIDELRDLLEHCMWTKELKIIVYPPEDDEP